MNLTGICIFHRCLSLVQSSRLGRLLPHKTLPNFTGRGYHDDRALFRVAVDCLHNSSTSKIEPPQGYLFGGGRRLSHLVPPADPVSERELEDLHNLFLKSRRLVVLTGAGISTESGIPDYRSPNGAYSTGFKPITHQEFLRSPASRQRYWARSYAGWRRFLAADPGPTHVALARLEGRGRLAGGIITQNVDRLHHKAGSSPLELHGTTHVVVCLDCGDLTPRLDFQERVRDLNPQWAEAVDALGVGVPGSSASFGMQQRPDGDIEIGDEFAKREDFRIPVCIKCQGTLKPDVVFFGDNVPKEKAESAVEMVTSGDGLLVIGSSLMVLSAFRLARLAVDRGAPLAIITVGPTRADEIATLKITARSGEVLSRLLSMGSMDVPVI